MTQATLDHGAPPLATARGLGEGASQLATEQTEKDASAFSHRAEMAVVAKLPARGSLASREHRRHGCAAARLHPRGPPRKTVALKKSITESNGPRRSIQPEPPPWQTDSAVSRLCRRQCRTKREDQLDGAPSHIRSR